MPKEKAKDRYQELLNEEFEMMTGLMDSYITFDEYIEPNRMGAAIESIFEDKHGKDVVREWRKEV